MKLLITTQAIDKNNPILGFFHRWVEEFAKHFEHIHVICLYEGEHSLPANVTVYSLGKETGENRIKYIWRFYRILQKLSGSYEAVFSHMNPHYIVLAGLYWKIKRIPFYFWRNHARMNWMTWVSAPLAKYVFYTSPFACTARYRHAIQMPVGVDTDFFIPNSVSVTNDTKIKILSLGRISPVKKLEFLVDAEKLLPSNYEIHIYGDSPVQDREYEKGLKSRASNNIFFHGSIKNTDAPHAYQTHDIFVNLTPNGSMDKTVLEAISCGVITLIANESFLDVIPKELYLSKVSGESLAERIQYICTRDKNSLDYVRQTSRKYVIEKHSLAELGNLLYKYIHE